MGRSVTLRRLAVVCGVSVVLTGSTGVFVGPVYAKPGSGATAASHDKSVPAATAKMQKTPRLADPPRATLAEPVWPKAGKVRVDLAAKTGGGRSGHAVVGGLPVTVSTAVSELPNGRMAPAAASEPTAVTVEVADRSAADKAGTQLALRLSRADGQPQGFAAKVEIGYGAYAEAFGANWSARLAVVTLPSCALTTPAADECRVPTRVASDNNNATKTLSAEVTAPSASAAVVVALAAAPSSEGGDFTRTDLQQSATWQAGGSSGDFSWSYPITVPPVPGGLTPEVSIGYSSGSVDGRTANNNVQPGWLGEGFSYDPGFIERRYRPCAKDTTVAPVWADTIDQCWRMANATLSWNGHATELIPDDTSNPPNTAMPTVWHLADDDGTKVEYMSDDGSTVTQNWHDEHWRLTTKDGTQYWFGLSLVPGTVTRTNSVQGMPVLSNHTGEPCFSSSSITNSWCSMAYRWNLDYVVDPHGNSMIYTYAKEQNYAHMPGTAGSGRTYDRASYLTMIEYGFRAGQEASVAGAPARVVFTVADRCWPQAGSSCAAHDGGDWPDVPWDLQHPSNGAVDPPTFFTSKRLIQIDTQVAPQGPFSYQSVDTYTFDSAVFGTGHACCGGVLNLRWIDHDGVAGSTVDLRPVYFGYGVAMQNRAAFVAGSGAEESWKFRLRQIVSESGGQTDITYAALDPGCLDGNNPPNPDYNYSLCFPQKYGNWTWWHKYIVSAVSEHDGTGASTTDVTHSYTYARNATVGTKAVGTSSVLWRHDLDTFSADLGDRSWNLWAGYPVVTEITGTGSGAGQSKTMRLYWTGLDGDRTDAGDGTRPVSLLDTESDAVGDHHDYGYRAGHLRETITFDGNTNTVLSKSLTDSSAIRTGERSISATWGASYEPRAWIPTDTAQNSYTWIANNSSWRRTSTAWSYDNLGNVTTTDAQGDVAVGTDDKCTTTTYLTNPAANLYRYDGASATTLNSTPVIVDPPTWGYNFSTATNDFTGDGKKDLIVRTDAGRIYVSPGTGSGTFSAGTLISTGFGNFRGLAVADFTGDGKPDIVGNLPDDRLLMYPGDGTGGIGGSVQIGTSGWAPFDDLFTPGDMTGDGRADLVGRRYSDGTLFLWPVTGNGSVGTAQPIGTSGWDLFSQVFGSGDYTGDGKADVLAADTSGVWVYPGSATSTVTLGARAALATGAIGPQTDWYIPTGDITGDGKPDLLARQLRYLVALPSTEHTVGKACGAAVTYPNDAVSDSRYYYDQPGATTPSLTKLPLAGDLTRTEHAKDYSGSTALWISAGETTAIDSFGRPTSVKDPLGKVTTTAYGFAYAGPHPIARQTTVTNPLGHQTVAVTDFGRGLPTSVTDPNGKVTTASYDGLGRLLKVWKPGHSTSGTPDAEYAYHVDGVTSPPYVTSKAMGPDGSQITSYQLLDGFLRTRQTQTPTADGKRGITDTVYDSRGLVVRSAALLVDGVPASAAVAVNDANATSQHRFSYDGLARQTRDELWSQNTPFWDVSITSYDGDRASVDFPAGGTDTTTILDALGRVSQVWQYSGTTPSGSHTVTQYAYEPAGNLVSETGPDGSVWTYDYDLLGRKISAVDPDAGSSTTSYDDAGQVSWIKDGRGQYLSFDYDDLGRKTAEYKTQTKTAANQLAGWAYDTVASAKGQLASATRYVGGNQVGGSAYARAVTDYDDGYRPEHVDLTIPSAEGALAGVYGTDYTYKTNGAPATQAATTKAGAAVGGLPLETLAFSYNSVGQQTGLTGAQTYLASAAYTFDGQTAEQILGTGTTQVRHTLDYSAITRRLDTSTVYTGTTGSWTTKAIDTYGRDPAGNVVGIVTSTNGVIDQYECFRYDFLRRLTDAWSETGYPCETTGTLSAGVDPYRLSWTYDAPGGDPLKSAGLRATETAYNPDGTTRYQSSYTYGGTNKPKHSLASVTTTGSGAGTKTYDYDLSGNTTSRPGPGGAQQALTWDAENRLTKVTDSSDTTFLYDADGARLIRRDPGGYSTLTVTDGTELRANGAGSVAATRYYGGCATRTANTNAAGDLTGGTTLKWNVTDEHGTGSIAVDPTTLQIDRRRSLPFGGPRGTQAGGFGTKGFVGGTSDPTGLVHLGAREYDPTTGRFVSADPVFDNANPQSWNGYAYANNAPATSSDPGGLWFPKNPDVPGPGQKPPSTGGGGKPGGGKPGGGKPGGGKPGAVICTPGYYGNCPRGPGDRQFCAASFVGPCAALPHNRCDDLDMSFKHCPFSGGASTPAVCGTAVYLPPCAPYVTWTPPPPSTGGPDKKKPTGPYTVKGKLLSGFMQTMFGASTWLGVQMGGVCSSVSGQAGIASVGTQCYVYDKQGGGITSSVGLGRGYGIGDSVTTGLEISNGTIEQQGGRSVYGDVGPGGGGRFDGWASASVDDYGIPNRVWSTGANVGGTLGVTSGSNGTTYTKTQRLFSWDGVIR